MKNPKTPPIQGDGNGLDADMPENTKINTEPDMAASKGPDDPDMDKGYSPGSLNHGPTVDDELEGFGRAFN